MAFQANWNLGEILDATDPRRTGAIGSLAPVGSAIGTAIKAKRRNDAKNLIEEEMKKLTEEGKQASSKDLTSLAARARWLDPDAAASLERQAETAQASERAMMEKGDIPELVPIQSQSKILSQRLDDTYNRIGKAWNEPTLFGTIPTLLLTQKRLNDELNRLDEQAGKILRGGEAPEEPVAEIVKDETENAEDYSKLGETLSAISGATTDGELTAAISDEALAGFPSEVKAKIRDKANARRKEIASTNSAVAESVKKGNEIVTDIYGELAKDAMKNSAGMITFGGLWNKVSQTAPKDYGAAKARLENVAKSLNSVAPEGQGEGIDFDSILKKALSFGNGSEITAAQYNEAMGLFLAQANALAKKYNTSVSLANKRAKESSPNSGEYADALYSQFSVPGEFGAFVPLQEDLATKGFGGSEESLEDAVE